MRVLGLFCSPRKRGNTDLLLDQFLKGAKEAGAETEKIHVCRIQIAPCNGCGACEKTGQCAIEDQMCGVYDRIDAADAIVLASPVYFYNVTAQCKTLIDRCQALWSRKYILKKRGRAKLGFFLSVGGTKGKKMFDCTILTVKYFFDAIDARYLGHLLFREIDKRGDIRSHPTALREALQAGIKLGRSTHWKNAEEEASSFQMER
ncbi:MAG: flavodoxin family protein [Proteobacteria bacterium]|nr:flavodoxin family protein [Pseudomonadota bacterium]